jgi:hypothetical protein
MRQQREIPLPILDEMRFHYESGDPKKSKTSWIVHTYARKYGWTEYDVDQYAGIHKWEKYSGPAHPGRIILGGDDEDVPRGRQVDPRIEAMCDEFVDLVLAGGAANDKVFHRGVDLTAVLTAKGDKRAKDMLAFIATLGKYRKIAAWTADEQKPNEDDLSRVSKDSAEKAAGAVMEKIYGASPAVQRALEAVPRLLNGGNRSGDLGVRSH